MKKKKKKAGKKEKQNYGRRFPLEVGHIPVYEVSTTSNSFLFEAPRLAQWSSRVDYVSGEASVAWVMAKRAEGGRGGKMGQRGQRGSLVRTIFPMEWPIQSRMRPLIQGNRLQRSRQTVLCNGTTPAPPASGIKGPLCFGIGSGYVCSFELWLNPNDVSSPC